jgi:uncharacterized C2H2 Zn-finger protein
MNDLSKRWIEAAKVLGKDSNAKVNCPKCASTFLTVFDVEITVLDKGKIDRYLKCPSCSASNVLTFNKHQDFSK